MKKIKEYKGIIIIVLVLILGAFYWFEYRPNMITKKCQKLSTLSESSDLINKSSSSIELYRNKYVPGYNETTKEINYKNCLRSNGLEK
jgi:hypothetical protein